MPKSESDVLPGVLPTLDKIGQRVRLGDKTPVPINMKRTAVFKPITVTNIVYPGSAEPKQVVRLHYGR